MNTNWTYKWEDENKEWALVIDEKGRVVANVNTETGPSVHSAPAMRPMPAEENARLIAAAPELLEALDNALALLGCYQSGTEVPPAVLANMMYEARAAIAKAKGE